MCVAILKQSITLDYIYIYSNNDIWLNISSICHLLEWARRYASCRKRAGGAGATSGWDLLIEWNFPGIWWICTPRNPQHQHTFTNPKDTVSVIPPKDPFFRCVAQVFLRNVSTNPLSWPQVGDEVMQITPRHPLMRNTEIAGSLKG